VASGNFEKLAGAIKKDLEGSRICYSVACAKGAMKTKGATACRAPSVCNALCWQLSESLSDPDDLWWVGIIKSYLKCL
jgi:hypothetical protein